MKLIKRNRNIMLVLASLLLLTALPALTFAQGRGHGRGPDLDKKCGKFVNCHDARDGRWDGRGPRMNRRIFRDDDDVSFPRDARRRGPRFLGPPVRERRFERGEAFYRSRRLQSLPY